jgi:tRNA (cmo5U34)-methyltransferase
MTDFTSSHTTKHDTIFADPMEQITRFCFDDNVANVFSDMIQRSVPGYGAILSMIGDISERYAQENSYCYDLGCSLGAATLAMRHSIKVPRCEIISIDNSTAMIERCQTLIDADKHSIPVHLQCADISNISIHNASIVILNFTLQFIEPTARDTLLRKIYQGLLKGGILILSEKIHFKNAPHQALMTDLYHNFKRVNGYSELEIAQKRTALEDVLRSDSIDTHRKRLNHCGFSSAELWFQCFSFCSFIAIK